MGLVVLKHSKENSVQRCSYIRTHAQVGGYYAGQQVGVVGVGVQACVCMQLCGTYSLPLEATRPHLHHLPPSASWCACPGEGDCSPVSLQQYVLWLGGVWGGENCLCTHCRCVPFIAGIALLVGDA